MHEMPVTQMPVKPAEDMRTQIAQLISVFDGQVHTIGREGCLIGRDASVGIAVPEKIVSRRHALITFEAGKYRLKDNGSRNGTFLNGEKLKSDTAYVLSHEDRIEIARFQYVFRLHRPDEDQVQIKGLTACVRMSGGRKQLVVALPKDKLSVYQQKMYENNRITGLFEAACIDEGEELLLYYEIDGHKRLDGMVMRDELEQEQALRLMLQIIQTIQGLPRYLLSESNLVLRPDMIFVGESGRPELLYFPLDEEQNAAEQTAWQTYEERDCLGEGAPGGCLGEGLPGGCSGKETPGRCLGEGLPDGRSSEGTQGGYFGKEAQGGCFGKETPGGYLGKAESALAIEKVLFQTASFVLPVYADELRRLGEEAQSPYQLARFLALKLETHYRPKQEEGGMDETVRPPLKWRWMQRMEDNQMKWGRRRAEDNQRRADHVSDADQWRVDHAPQDNQRRADHVPNADQRRVDHAAEDNQRRAGHMPNPGHDKIYIPLRFSFALLLQIPVLGLLAGVYAAHWLSPIDFLGFSIITAALDVWSVRTWKKPKNKAA